MQPHALVRSARQVMRPPSWLQHVRVHPWITANAPSKTIDLSCFVVSKSCVVLAVTWSGAACHVRLALCPFMQRLLCRFGWPGTSQIAATLSDRPFSSRTSTPGYTTSCSLCRTSVFPHPVRPEIIRLSVCSNWDSRPSI